MRQRPKVKFQNRFVERALIETNFQILELSENQLILKAQKKKDPIQNQLFYLAALVGTVYFSFFDYQPFILIPLIIILVILVASKIIYPLRIKNEIFRFNHAEGYIEFRSGLSKDLIRIDLLPNVKLVFQIDEFGGGSGQQFYSSTLFYCEENSRKREIVIQYDHRHESKVLKFTNALQRYLVNLSEIEEMPIKKKYK